VDGSLRLRLQESADFGKWKVKNYADVFAAASAKWLKSVAEQIPRGEHGMLKWKKKRSRLERLSVLILLGLLAGAVGGLGIGLIQLHQMSASSSSSSSTK
jgi:hypothetical protein